MWFLLVLSVGCKRQHWNLHVCAYDRWNQCQIDFCRPFGMMNSHKHLNMGWIHNRMLSWIVLIQAPKLVLYKVLFHNFGGSYPPSVTSSRTQDHIIVIALAFYTHHASGIETATHQDQVLVLCTLVCAHIVNTATQTDFNFFQWEGNKGLNLWLSTSTSATMKYPYFNLLSAILAVTVFIRNVAQPLSICHCSRPNQLVRLKYKVVQKKDWKKTVTLHHVIKRTVMNYI